MFSINGSLLFGEGVLWRQTAVNENALYGYCLCLAVALLHRGVISSVIEKMLLLCTVLAHS